MDKLWREGADVGSGSTAAAVRLERLTGLPVKGKMREIKARETIENLKGWLRNNPNASLGDRAAAQNVLLDLLDALGGN